MPYADRNRQLAAQREWYQRNKALHLARTSHWQIVNREKRREYSRRYYAADRPRAKAYRRKWELRNRARLLVAKRQQKARTIDDATWSRVRKAGR